MKRKSMITAGTVLSFLMMASVSHAQADGCTTYSGYPTPCPGEDPNELQPGEDMTDAPSVIGSSKAVCTLRRCRWKASCDATGEGFPGFLTPGCLFLPTLYGNKGPLTAKGTCIPGPGDDPDEVCDPAEAKPVFLDAGQAKKLRIKVTRLGKMQMKAYLKRGTRTLKKGTWEADRLLDTRIVDKYDPFGGLTSYGADLAETYEAYGFSTAQVAGGYFVWQDGDLKVRLKG